MAKQRRELSKSMAILNRYIDENEKFIISEFRRLGYFDIRKNLNGGGFHVLVGIDEKVKVTTSSSLEEYYDEERKEVTRELFIKIPLMNNKKALGLYKNSTYTLLFSNKKSRFNGQTEAWLIDSKKLVDYIEGILASTDEFLQVYTVRKINGYLLLPLRDLKMNNIALHQYVIQEEKYNIVNVESLESFDYVTDCFNFKKYTLQAPKGIKRSVVVANITTQEIETYETVDLAAKACGVHPSTLSTHLTGKQKTISKKVDSGKQKCVATYATDRTGNRLSNEVIEQTLQSLIAEAL